MSKKINIIVCIFSIYHNSKNTIIYICKLKIHEKICKRKIYYYIYINFLFIKTDTAPRATKQHRIYYYNFIQKLYM